jgi:hypothetical protein
MEAIKVLDEISENYIGCMYGEVLRCYTKATSQQSGEVLLDRGDGYTKVTRGTKWLVECALLDMEDWHTTRSQNAPLRKALEALLIPQSIYDSTKYYEVFEGEEDMFSVNGPTSPALRIFTTGPHCDEAAIEHVVEFVMREALNVAAVWDQQAELNNWGSRGLSEPSYGIFVGSFVEAHARFKAAIEAISTPGRIQETFLPHHVRVVLKEIDFVDMWQCWWEDAAEIQGQTGDDRHAARMYEEIVNRTLKRAWALAPEFLDMQALLKRVWKVGRLAYATWPSPEYPGLPLLPHNVSWRVLGGITKDSEWQKRLGRWFYGEKTRCAFWEREFTVSEQDTTTDFAKGPIWDHAKYMDTGIDYMDNV